MHLLNFHIQINTVFFIQILEKIGLKDDMLPKVNEWMTKVVLPHYTTLVGEQQVELQDERMANSNFQESSQQPIRESITTILNKAIENPEMVILLTVLFDYNAYSILQGV